MWRNSSLGIIAKALWEYTKTHRMIYISMMVFLLISHSLDLIGPYAIGQIINILQAYGHDGVSGALQWVYLILIIKIIEIILNNTGDVFEKKLTRVTCHRFMQDFYKKSQSLPLLWHQDHHSGDMVSRLNKAYNALGTFVGAPSMLLWMGISFFGSAIILVKLMPVIGISVIILCFITIIATALIDKKIQHYGTITNTIYHKVTATLNDYLGNIRTIIILRLGIQTRNDIQKRLKDTVAPFNMELRYKLTRWFTTQTCIEAAVILSLIYILRRFEKDSGNIQIGNIVMIITYLRQMAVAVYNSSRYYGTLVQSVIDYRGFDLVDNAYSDYIKIHKENDHEIKDWSHISVSDLSFFYSPEQTAPVLDNLSFTMTMGQKIALVGASGGGKSTLMSVLRGLYPTTNGQTVIDNTPYSDIEPLASISTLIPQEPEIFENTIRYNITLGVEHSDEEIMEACRIACFDTVIDELPNGLDSKINEKGVNLSGGQKQRLALARGIFAIQDSSLVLFDEPTSSVDSMTERLMYKNLFEAFPQICLISSIHRLNLLNQFDTIWVMQKGQMVQQGSLQELLGQPDKPFLKLWTAYQNEEPI